MATLKLYYDFLSQPSRALYILLKHHKIPFESVIVNIMKGEQKSEEFQKVSKFQKLPAVDDNGVKMIESVAILRYLARTRNLPDTFYSQDVLKQLRIDEYLEWQHNNTRNYLSMYFVHKFILPTLYNKPENPKNVAQAEKQMVDCIDGFDKIWLSPGPFLTGNDVTAADLWAACEMEQPRMLGYDPRKGRSKLTDWIEKVREHFNPAYDKAHGIVYKIEQMTKTT